MIVLFLFILQLQYKTLNYLSFWIHLLSALYASVHSFSLFKNYVEEDVIKRAQFQFVIKLIIVRDQSRVNPRS